MDRSRRSRLGRSRLGILGRTSTSTSSGGSCSADDRRIHLLILMRGIGMDGGASDGPAGFVPGGGGAGSAAASLGLSMSSLPGFGFVFVVAIIADGADAIIIAIAIFTCLPSPSRALTRITAAAIITIGTAIRFQWGLGQSIAIAVGLAITIATSGGVSRGSCSDCSGLVITRIGSARSGGRHDLLILARLEGMNRIGADENEDRAADRAIPAQRLPSPLLYQPSAPLSVGSVLGR
mmetsp:Transcript_29340/g.85338  ORF Transcript_29340/g.85338 Transcript_29340/m.85338 type:complete len:236 (-) Transcript_29340:12-719(-)